MAASAVADNGKDAHPGVAPGGVELAYRTVPLLADYLRGWAGLALAAFPLVTMEPAWPVVVGLLAMIGLFLTFLVQTWRRHRSRVILAPAGVALVRQAEQRVAWQDLDGLRLRWFGSRRHGKGWLELELRGRGVKLVLTSALDRFDDVVADAVQAAGERRLALEPATQANVEALLGRAA
jgi:hypothetical protein